MRISTHSTVATELRRPAPPDGRLGRLHPHCPVDTVNILLRILCTPVTEAESELLWSSRARGPMVLSKGSRGAAV
jgi:hypothetical protein